MNSVTFPVTSGQPLTFTIRARVDPPTPASGCFDIIFLNDTGENKRSTVPVTIAGKTLGDIFSGLAGRNAFHITGLTSGTWGIRAWFAGSDEFWPAMADGEFTL